VSVFAETAAGFSPVLILSGFDRTLPLPSTDYMIAAHLASAALLVCLQVQLQQLPVFTSLAAPLIGDWGAEHRRDFGGSGFADGYTWEVEAVSGALAHPWLSPTSLPDTTVAPALTMESPTSGSIVPLTTTLVSPRGAGRPKSVPSLVEARGSADAGDDFELGSYRSGGSELLGSWAVDPFGLPDVAIGYELSAGVATGSVSRPAVPESHNPEKSVPTLSAPLLGVVVAAVYLAMLRVAGIRI
jgi:hypothetical protein